MKITQSFKEAVDQNLQLIKGQRVDRDLSRMKSFNNIFYYDKNKFLKTK
jgi:hypothetical protein